MSNQRLHHVEMCNELEAANDHIKELEEACRIGLGYVKAALIDYGPQSPAVVNVVLADVALIKRALDGKEQEPENDSKNEHY